MVQVQSIQERVSAGDSKPLHHTITVMVNVRPVVFDVHRATGADIKAEAIRQGVPIQADFVLFELRGQGTIHQVDDGEEVVLHPQQEFRAVAPDDTSGGHR